jgi:hypothetical protein
MELFVTSATLFARQLIGSRMQHGEANRALLDAVESFISVTFPQSKTVSQRTILHISHVFTLSDINLYAL